MTTRRMVKSRKAMVLYSELFGVSIIDAAGFSVDELYRVLKSKGYQWDTKAEAWKVKVKRQISRKKNGMDGVILMRIICNRDLWQTAANDAVLAMELVGYAIIGKPYQKESKSGGSTVLVYMKFKRD